MNRNVICNFEIGRSINLAGLWEGDVQCREALGDKGSGNRRGWGICIEARN